MQRIDALAGRLLPRICEAQQYLREQAFDTRLVYLADREADLFEIYAQHQQQLEREEQAADWLIRAQHDRNTAAGTKLWSAVEAAPELGRVEFHLPASKKRTGRKIVQRLQALRITLMAPQQSEKTRPIEVTALLARELNPPLGEAPIEWMLLTNLEVTSLDQAEQKLSWYLCCWQVEIFFRILKSACKIEDLQLEKIERLEPAILLYRLIAWRILFFAMVGRECPELPCNLIFDDDEWKAVYIVSKKRLPPETPPTLHEMIRMIASFGGFLNRTGHGLPGPRTIWIGLQRSKDFALAIESLRMAGEPDYG
ncbi:MAG: IS4 family transposase [Gammaproteobacteria bacterium]